MQFILRQNTLVCQFASPLDVDTHNKPEAVVLEGKYWKRKLAAVTAEYKKWRMFYRNKILGWTNKDGPEILESMDVLEWSNCVGVSGNYGSTSGNSYGSITGASSGESMMVDEDYMQLMTDTLFSTISSNQPIYFPDPREIARGASLADFIQPSLGPLQPNLDDFMDTLEPLQEFLNFKLAPVPEEEDVFRAGALTNNYPELDLMAPIEQINDLVSESSTKPDQNVQQYSIKAYNTPQVGTVAPIYRNNLSINESYNIIQQEFGAQGGNPVARCTPEKLRQSRPCAKASRMMQQPRQQETEQPPQQQQQPNAYQQVRPHSGAVFQHTAPTSQQQSYQLPIQAVQLNQMTSQVQVAQLSDQTAENTELNAMTGHLQNLATLQSTYPGNPLLQMQQKVIQTLPDSPITTKPYKIVQPQQDFKYSTIATPTFNVQQCKFNANNFKPSLNQQLAPVTTPQTIQSQLMLQPRPVMEQQLGAPSVVATKQTESISTKEEIFAVPKYQMKARNRSRSSSSLTPARVHPPPLVSTASDPALNLNSNVLLAHLLTNNTTTSLYTMSTSDKIIPAVSQTTPVKHILPLLPSAASEQVTASTRQTPVTVQTLPVAQQPIQTGQQQVLLNPNNQTHPQGSPGSPKDSQAHSPQPLSVSPLHSPMSLGSPLSPTRGYLKDSERGQYKEQRRVGHIHAEQKRRYNIKNGFDTLHNLIPQLNQNPSTKLSKAAMLQKGADYIRQLRIERSQLKEEMDHLRHQIESLNTSISNCQSMLPATGAPVSRHRTNKMKEMFDDYVRTRTQDNWKFWIFSILFEPLLISFNTSVSTASIEDLYRSTILWVEQHCSLVDLRPAVLNSLRYLCTATEILSDPGRLPEEALAAVNRNENRRSAQ
ncbi:MLX-interacting protein isoform X2 [Prorops nasuta]